MLRWTVEYLWLIPLLPLLAAGLSAVTKRPGRAFAASLAIGAMSLALLLSCLAFAEAARHPGRQYVNFPWVQMGDSWLKLGWVLDPLSAVMLVMVSFVGLLIFIYSLGYMAEDENFTRFFCFLSLFAAAMLGVVIANSLLLLFICWELVGLTSYLLIGFWYHKPSAAAAARKAFITTRIGDLAFLVGMVWLYAGAGRCCFMMAGNGCLEQSGAPSGRGRGERGPGRFGRHWPADLLRGGRQIRPGAAPCLAAGRDGRADPGERADPRRNDGRCRRVPRRAGVSAYARGAGVPVRLDVVAWVGAITAVFAASIAVAQTDIKRILAYSTVSQLGS